MFGANLKSQRLGKCLSLTGLATRAQISKSYLSELENNKKLEPSYDVILRICKVLEIKPMDLIINTCPCCRQKIGINQ